MSFIIARYTMRQVGAMTEPVLTVSDFVAIFNQTLEYAYPSVTITGELANFRISKNRWVYFDLKDEFAILRFFGTVYRLPGPLQDGMLLEVKGMPRFHPQYGFSVNILTIRPTGEGSIKKAAALLEAKLAGEGLFDAQRKRILPYPPQSIGLITSVESAAYKDFTKVINARWGGMAIFLMDVQVQGELAVGQIVTALNMFNQQSSPPEVIVLTRGGGSAEDLQVFSTEQVTRAVARSRIPVLVAIGHEIDVSLAELAADQRASTPSNAAELLVPDRKALKVDLGVREKRLHYLAGSAINHARRVVRDHQELLAAAATRHLIQSQEQLKLRSQLLQAFSPQAALRRGYALIRKDSTIVRSGSDVGIGDELTLQLIDADVAVETKRVAMRKGKHDKK